ncbi:MAG: glutamate synthase-related protein [Myxococcota bacterium]
MVPSTGQTGAEQLRITDTAPLVAANDVIEGVVEKAAPPAPRPDTFIATPAEHIVDGAIARFAEDGVKPARGTPDVVSLRANLTEAPTAPLVKRIIARVEADTKSGIARHVLHPGLQLGRHGARHVGAFANAYMGSVPAEYARKFRALELLHETGSFAGAYGHAQDQAPLVLSKLLPTRSVLQTGLADQTATIGHDMLLTTGEVVPIRKAKMSLMVGTSGMSFPQLSARSVLALVFANAALAEKGVHYLLNTGEGGPDAHLALLTGDHEGLRSLVINHGLATGELKADSMDHARVDELIRRLMAERDALFATIGPDAVKQAQITAQFGSAFNGIRDAEGGIDFAKLQHIGMHASVAMVEFKLKQAAKRGSKVDMKKMDRIAAAIREVSPGQKFKSPALNPEIDSYEDIATLVIATKLLTGKPVSLKFGVGDVENMREFLQYLEACGALPDHIQIDGAGKHISPGSGNAPPTGAAGDSSLTAREGLIAVDTILKHLGVRDQVFLTVAGEIMLPNDAVEAMALGADGTLGARTWMAMGLGCAGVRACDSGACPYGIASKQGSIFAEGPDPQVVGPRAVAAAQDWHDHLLVEMTETGTTDWRTVRKTHGLHADEEAIAIRDSGRTQRLRDAYSRDSIHALLRTALRPGEIDQAVYGYRPTEYIAYQRFDAERRLENRLDGLLTRDPARAEEAARYRVDRMHELRQAITTGIGRHDLRDLIDAPIPPRLGLIKRAQLPVIRLA